jgi:hypothetical protein
LTDVNFIKNCGYWYDFFVDSACRSEASSDNYF